MAIIDLSAGYRDQFVDRGDRSAYESSLPELFAHYYRFWARSESDLAATGNTEIQIRKKWIENFINRITPGLQRDGIDTDAIDYIYFIGVGTTNGHAFRYHDRMTVWLPLETYTTERRVRVFVAHELAHALHYHYRPSFYFNTKQEQIQMSRQLITEGLATYLTMNWLKVSDLESLWADYIEETDARNWLQACQSDSKILFKLILDNFHASKPEIAIFYASNPDDIFQYRAGYFAGLRLIERFAQETDLSSIQLLQLRRQKFENDIRALIQKLI